MERLSNRGDIRLTIPRVELEVTDRELAGFVDGFTGGPKV